MKKHIKEFAIAVVIFSACVGLYFTQAPECRAGAATMQCAD